MGFFLIVMLLILIVGYFKNKIANYILSMWMVENDYPPPNKQDMERLAKKVVDKWFKKY